MYVDILITMVLIGFLVIGFSLGFFVEFISLFGLFGNFLVVKYLNPILIEFIKKYYSDINYTISYAILFVILYLLLIIVVRYINILFIGQDKNIINRFGGGIISLLKGVIVTVVIISILVILSNQYPALEKYINESKIIEYYLEIEVEISDYLPDELKVEIEDIKEKEILDKYIKKIL